MVFYNCLMKKVAIISFVAGVILTTSVGFFIIRSGNGLITRNEEQCFVEKNINNEIVASKDQAICLAESGEATYFHGIGSPFYAPDGFVRIILKSKKIILVENNSSEFQQQLETLGVARISK